MKKCTDDDDYDDDDDNDDDSSSNKRRTTWAVTTEWKVLATRLYLLAIMHGSLSERTMAINADDQRTWIQYNHNSQIIMSAAHSKCSRNSVMTGVLSCLFVVQNTTNRLKCERIEVKPEPSQKLKITLRSKSTRVDDPNGETVTHLQIYKHAYNTPSRRDRQLGGMTLSVSICLRLCHVSSAERHV